MTAPLHRRRDEAAAAPLPHNARRGFRPPGASATATSTPWPGIATVIAGAILLDGAVITAAYRGSSPISEDQFSFPWNAATAVATSLTWAAAQALLVVGLVAFVRTHTHSGRLGRAGGRMAIGGGLAYVAAHLVSAFAYDASTDEIGAILAMSLFGIGTLALAAGLLAAGSETPRSSARSWTRYAPLALGSWMLLMIPLQFTAALAVAVGVYAVLIIAFGVALIEDRQ